MTGLCRIGVLCLVLVACNGCGSHDEVIKTPENQVFVAVNSSAEELKQRLEGIAASGDGGSALEGLTESIEKNVTDPAKKASLLKDAALLNTLTEPDRIKPVAKRMADQL
jgi:hypothetical protein